jgi:hypothetical protein
MKMIPKSVNRRKYYKSSSYSLVLNGPRAGSEFVVMLVTIMKISVLKTCLTSMILASEVMKIVFCCCGCSSWENIAIGVNIGKKMENIE